jgi:hypothetical protein
MSTEGGMIQLVISSATIIGGIGYILHTVWTGYQEFKKYVYENMVKKGDCREYRESCRVAEDRARGGRKDG